MAESPVFFIAYDAGEVLGYFASREPAEETAEAYRAAWRAEQPDQAADHIEVREVLLRTEPRLPVGTWDPQPTFDELTPEEQTLARIVGRPFAEER